jgi:hypothetical protein
MKKVDLDSELKRASVPERDQDFWDAFPQRVMARASAAPPTPAPRISPMDPIVWNLGMALACLTVCLCLWETRLPKTLCYDLIQHEREMRDAARAFPNQVRAFMQDEHGLGKLVEDQP